MDCTDFFNKCRTNGTRWLALEVFKCSKDLQSRGWPYAEVGRQLQSEYRYIRGFLQTCFRDRSAPALEEVILFGAEESAEPCQNTAFDYPLGGGIEFEDPGPGWTRSKNVTLRLLARERQDFINWDSLKEEEEEIIEKSILGTEEGNTWATPEIGPKVVFKNLSIGGKLC
jgi:hypothetical protein